MDKKIKICIALTIIGLAFIILIATFVRINEDEKQDKYDYLIQNYIEMANKCVEIKKCESGNISLRELKEKEFISDVYNPLTNEEFNLSSFVSTTENKFYIVTEVSHK